MDKQNEMILSRRKAKKVARFEDDINTVRQLLNEAEANQALHVSAVEETKTQQDQMVSQSLSVTLKLPQPPAVTLGYSQTLSASCSHSQLLSNSLSPLQLQSLSVTIHHS